MLSLKQSLLLLVACLSLCNADPRPGINLNRRFEFENRTYEISTDKLLWYDAFDFCGGKSMVLMDIVSQAENDAILANIDSLEDYWTSGNDIGQENRFIWGIGGVDFTFMNWGRFQPNDARNHNCVQLNSAESHTWDDADCTVKKLYICEQA